MLNRCDHKTPFDFHGNFFHMSGKGIYHKPCKRDMSVFRPMSRSFHSPTGGAFG